MIIETRNYDLIGSMLWGDDELFQRISDDYTNIQNWKPWESTWLAYVEDNRVKGLLSITQETAIVVNIHIHIPKKYRGAESFKIGNALLTYLEENADKRIVKINAKIPVKFPDVIRYAEKNGLVKEGLDIKSYIKDGKYFDRVIMGKVIK